MNTQSAVPGIVTCLALAWRWAWATRLAVSAVEVSAEFAFLGPKQRFTQCLWWEQWPGAVWHWGLWQKSGNNNGGLVDGPSPLGCTLQIRLMQCHMSPGLHDRGGIKAVFLMWLIQSPSFQRTAAACTCWLRRAHEMHEDMERQHSGFVSIV